MAEIGFQAVDAPVERVELFEDRAAVTRRLKVGSAGRHRIIVGPVTPLISEDRLSFPSTTEGVVVEEVRIRRGASPQEVADPEAVRALTERLGAARDERAAQADTVRRARESHLRARQASQAAQSATVRALQEQDDVAGWAKAVEGLAAQQGVTVRAVADTELELARLTEIETSLARQLDRLRRGTGAPVEDPQSTDEVVAVTDPGAGPVQAWLELSLMATGPSEQAIRYVVPCALWRPTHRASLEEVAAEAVTNGDATEEPVPTARVDWQSWAACWNATGEDWIGVQVVCSTAREVDKAHPQAIQDDVIRVQHSEGELPDDPSDEVVGDPPPVDVQRATHLPGVDDGGQPRTFEVEGPVDLPCDGRVTSVLLHAWSVPATTHWTAVPEHSPLVMLRSEQRNGSDGVLLAGPVDRLRHGVHMGRALVPMVGEGLRFTLDWGSHDGVHIARRRSHEIERQKATATLTHRFRVELQVHHGGTTPLVLQLRERVPVSEYSDVFVTGPETEPLSVVDDQGFLSWALELDPGAREALSLTYTIRAADDADLPFSGP